MTTTASSSHLQVPTVAQPRVRAVAERLLMRSEAAGTLPTPLDTVAACAGIEEVLDISQLPAPLAARKPSFLRRVVGALWYREQVVFVDYSQPNVRARFTQAHEIGHRALPWHCASHELFYDDQATLHPDTELELEAEANLLAAQLLFQGHRFHEQALDYQLTLATPTLLAPRFGASLTATIRFYVEHHPEPVALAVTGQYRAADETVPVWSTVASPSFLAQHGPFEDWFPCGRLLVSDRDTARPLSRLAAKALRGEELPDLVLRRGAQADEVRRYRAEAFYNQRCVFLMVTPHRVARLGRRVTLAS